jgi:hypothetical protein
VTLRFIVPTGERSRLVAGYQGVIALRWLGIALLLVSALTTPLPVWLPGSIAVAAVAAGYNLAAMALQRQGVSIGALASRSSLPISWAVWSRC